MPRGLTPVLGSKQCRSCSLILRLLNRRALGCRVQVLASIADRINLLGVRVRAGRWWLVKYACSLLLALTFGLDPSRVGGTLVSIVEAIGRWNRSIEFGGRLGNISAYSDRQRGNAAFSGGRRGTPTSLVGRRSSVRSTSGR